MLKIDSLNYFLTQIDRLSFFENISLVIACREFDRHYDYRISEINWDCEVECKPLDWKSQISPFLESLDIDTTTIDSVTKALIQNPRELSLFVELALKNKNINVISTQDILQKYFDFIVKSNSKLGEKAIIIIEKIASIMFGKRRLSISRKTIECDDDILWLLLSLNILQETQNNELTFGHQTLMDVLIVQDAIRRGVSLRQFVFKLPQVPFVRPSIRSYIQYLATGDRLDLRKQLRAVLYSNASFHIRRLIAETFAEIIPEDADWTLINDLRKEKFEIFSILYNQAKHIEWYYFWNEYLVPLLTSIKDSNGLIRHVNRVSNWIKTIPTEILLFWNNIFNTPWIDTTQIIYQVSHHLLNIDSQYLVDSKDFIFKLLDSKKEEYNNVGPLIVKSIEAGIVSDSQLWKYITDDINEENVKNINLDSQLNCRPQQFGDSNDKFLIQRFKQSTILLDLSIDAIEKWSDIKSFQNKVNNNNHNSFFLENTSFRKVHSQYYFDNIDSVDILLDAMESAILSHAENHSEWWIANREKLCFSKEYALLYFTIKAFILVPENNSTIIGQLFTSKLLESELSYELANLINASYIYLSKNIQSQLATDILSLFEEFSTKEQNINWIMIERANYAKAIPCHLRSQEIQDLIENYEKRNGILVREPDIRQRGGIVQPPFSYEVFNKLNDQNILNLLSHYKEYNRSPDDFLIGGSQSVARELQEASSREPLRFIKILSSNFERIWSTFRDAILVGASHYIHYKYGNLCAPDTWQAQEEPEILLLVDMFLKVLETNIESLENNRSFAEALLGCSYGIIDKNNAERISQIALIFDSVNEESSHDSEDLLSVGLNMIQGKIAQAVITLMNNLQENNQSFPQSLLNLLDFYSKYSDIAVRIMILRQLPFLLYHNHDFAWPIFLKAIEKINHYWKYAERCLYHSYEKHYEKVSTLLLKIYNKGSDNDFATWGRISALTVFSGYLKIENFIQKLNELDKENAWKGAADVWTHPANYKARKEYCIIGIEAGLNSSYPLVLASKIDELFKEDNFCVIPLEIIQKCFDLIQSDENKKQNSFMRMDKWLKNISRLEPKYALDVFEKYLLFIQGSNTHIYNYQDNLTQLITWLFEVAEEYEETDGGNMLKRVIAVQDTLLLLGVNGLEKWLKEAERP